MKKILAAVLLCCAMPVAAQAAEIVGLGGKCLDITGGRADDGTPVILWDCHGGGNQRWRIR